MAKKKKDNMLPMAAATILQDYCNEQYDDKNDNCGSCIFSSGDCLLQNSAPSEWGFSSKKEIAAKIAELQKQYDALG